MSLVEESRGYWYIDTSQSYSIYCGGCESREHVYLDNRHSTSSNWGGSGFRSSLTSHSSSRNIRGYVDRSGSRSQETIHYSSKNLGKELILKGEVDIGLSPATIPPITNLKVVDC